MSRQHYLLFQTKEQADRAEKIVERQVQPFDMYQVGAVDGIKLFILTDDDLLPFEQELIAQLTNAAGYEFNMNSTPEQTVCANIQEAYTALGDGKPVRLVFDPHIFRESLVEAHSRFQRKESL
jgi:hypothetical protein